MLAQYRKLISLFLGVAPMGHTALGPTSKAETLFDLSSASRITKFSKTIIPMADRVLVQRIKPVQKTASGLYIPEKAQEAINEGYVIAVGKGLVTQEGKIIASELKEGDKVLLPPFGGSAIKVDNEELILFRDSEILAKIQ
ncbi:10 kDa heat shock protein [Podila epicladia]|nr:10 kDa heat shock protein [Podila epicladia]